jgi:asparagine synthase (glutamine-hydrolysing)
MCGIAGEIRFNNTAADSALVARMTDTLSRRGPDSNGLYAQGPVALGHRRLKIIDLSEAAQQPMVDAALGLSIVFNGCIYNHHELRAELETCGYRFFSKGDTEVLLKAYHAWGEDFVKRLHGMFAFCIYERDSGKAILGRDRLGIKPLYYSERDGIFHFASTLPALLHVPGLDRRLDPHALHYYFSFHAVVPPPYTILRGVRKLAPGTIVTIDRHGRKKTARYWHLDFTPHADDSALSPNDWKEQVLAALRLAVKRRLVADVPVGVLLSGGLDSSLIVGLLAEAGQHDLKTFSIGFETVGNEQGDEFQYSDIIAKEFATDHHKMFIDSNRALPELANCVAAMAEPMVSHDAIGFYLLSQEVSQHVKVVQSGQGADEIFAGYHWYPPMMESKNPPVDYARVFFDRSHEEICDLLTPEFITGNCADDFVRRHFDMPGAPDGIHKTLRIDSTIMLVDDPVKRVDNMTMAWGLEARVPFLDHELVELAARTPADLKVRDGGKYILKEAARQVIPTDVIDRPKGYFPVPALKYLRGDFLDFVRGVLNSEPARNRGLYRRPHIDKLLYEPENHMTPLRGSKLWQVALLEYWLQTHHL